MKKFSRFLPTKRSFNLCTLFFFTLCILWILYLSLTVIHVISKEYHLFRENSPQQLLHYFKASSYKRIQKNERFRYKGRILNGSFELVGKYFDIRGEQVKKLHFPMKDFFRLSKNNIHDFIFVTAANSIYFNALELLITNIQKYFPDKRILVFDIGLKRRQASYIHEFCNVTLTNFKRDFSFLPRHIYEPTKYTWKPVVIYEALRSYGATGVWWVDTSVRFQSSNMSKIYNKLQESDGLLGFSGVEQLSFALSMNKTYEYLPTRVDRMKDLGQIGTGSLMVYRTYRAVSRVLNWWLLCAFDENCMNPSRGERLCSKAAVECNRNDQSTLNILLANSYNFKLSNYQLNTQTFRYSRSDVEHKVRACRRNSKFKDKLKVASSDLVLWTDYGV